MNTKKQTSVVIATSILVTIIATLIAGVSNSQTWGQQQNATNATNATTGTVINQTGGGTLANLTSQDFESIQDTINEARGAIHDNDPESALEALNDTQTLVSELSSSEPAEDEEDGASEDGDGSG
jgi:hypothetical protein